MDINETDIASDFGELTVFCTKKCAWKWLEENIHFEKVKPCKDGLEIVKASLPPKPKDMGIHEAI